MPKKFHDIHKKIRQTTCTIVESIQISKQLLRANMQRLQFQTEKQMLYKLYFNNDDISSAVIRIVE